MLMSTPPGRSVHKMYISCATEQKQYLLKHGHGGLHRPEQAAIEVALQHALEARIGFAQRVQYIRRGITHDTAVRGHLDAHSPQGNYRSWVVIHKELRSQITDTYHIFVRRDVGMPQEEGV